MYDRQKELEEEYWYHQNCKWDHLQELKKEHEDPFWDCENEIERLDHFHDKELIEQLKKDEGLS